MDAAVETKVVMVLVSNHLMLFKHAGKCKSYVCHGKLISVTVSQEIICLEPLIHLARVKVKRKMIWILSWHAYYYLTIKSLFWSEVCSPFIWPQRGSGSRQLPGHDMETPQETDRLNWHAKCLLARDKREGLTHTVNQKTLPEFFYPVPKKCNLSVSSIENFKKQKSDVSTPSDNHQWKLLCI